MNQTINISLPTNLTNIAKAQVKAGNYSSISEVIRDALRKTFLRPPELTINGFTQEQEDEILQISRTSPKDDLTWNTDADIKKFFKQLRADVK